MSCKKEFRWENQPDINLYPKITWIQRWTGFLSMYSIDSFSLGGIDSSILPGTSTNLIGFLSNPAFLEISNLISISFSVRSSLKIKRKLVMKNDNFPSFWPNLRGWFGLFDQNSSIIPLPSPITDQSIFILCLLKLNYCEKVLFSTSIYLPEQFYYSRASLVRYPYKC